MLCEENIVPHCLIIECCGTALFGCIIQEEIYVLNSVAKGAMTMKRMMLVWVMILCLVPLGAWAEGTAESGDSVLYVQLTPEQKSGIRYTYISGDWKYDLLEGGGARLSAYTGSEGEIVIPEEIDGYPVLDLKWNLFIGNYTLIVPETHPGVELRDGVLFGKNDHRLICYPKNLTAASYVIPDGTEVIGNYAFFDCDRLSDVTIPDSVTEIGDSAFHGCSSLTHIRIPDSVAVVGDHVFSECNSLVEIEVGKQAVNVGNAVSFCPNLLRIRVDEGNPHYFDEDGVLFCRDDEIDRDIGQPPYALAKYPAGRPGAEYVIPDGVNRIDARAFDSCGRLVSVVIPDSVVEIGYLAFCDCADLTSVTVPASVVSFGMKVVSGCDRLVFRVYPGSRAEEAFRYDGVPYEVIGTTE